MNHSGRVWAVHPFLLGIFPVIFLYARNVTEVRWDEVFLPLVAIEGAILVLFVALIPLIRDCHGRALVLFVTVFLFFLFGPLTRELATTDIFAEGAAFSPEIVAITGTLLILTVAVVFILRSKMDLARFSKLATQVGLVLLVVQFAVALYNMLSLGEAIEVEETISAPLREVGETSPDVYYIILDGYARSDVLRDLYDYDNSGFLESLESRGFYIADSCYANYNSTAQSLSSCLNMNYLHLIMPTDRREFSRLPTAILLENNLVMNHFRRYGYSTVSFSTGYTPTEVQFTDYYFSPGWTLSEFENHLLNLTPVPLLMAGFKSQFDLHRDRIEFILARLAHLEEVPTPRFVFAHISCPHPPFVFGPEGQPVAREWTFSFSDGDHYWGREGTLDEYLSGYRNQVRYISGRILETVDAILANSKRPPVILLQGDHGPGSHLYWEDLSRTNLVERFSILNAYHLPNVDTVRLYKSISPVNSFRVVLNQYFGTEYQRLPDLSYFTTWTRPYDYHDVTGSLPRSQPVSENP